MPYCALSNEKRECSIVHVLNQEHGDSTRCKISKISVACSKSEARVAVYIIEFEKVVVKAGRGTLTYAFNQGSISSCFMGNWI